MRRLVNIAGKNKTDIYKRSRVLHFNTVNNKYPPGYFRCCSPFKKHLKGVSEKKKGQWHVNIYTHGHLYALALSYGCSLALLN